MLTGCIGGKQEPDPMVEDIPIAYVKRPLLRDDNNNLIDEDVTNVNDFRPGGDLYLRDRASPTAEDRNITESITQGMGDVKDVEVSYDGTKLLFALRLPEIEGADEDEQPTWNIWEYEIATGNLRRVIQSDTTAELGQDVAPFYLPDGRIVFSSTRQARSRSILLDEGLENNLSKDGVSALDENQQEPASVLHVMNADGTDIKQISFNQSHDLDPVVLSSGEVLFSRWDNAGANNEINLYKVNPDGTDVTLVYGSNSHDTGTAGTTVQFIQPRELPDGRILTVLRPFNGTGGGGQIVAIDIANYIDNDQASYTGASTGGSAQQQITSLDVRTDNAPSLAGRLRAAYPLWDGTDRILISWSACRVSDNGRIVPCTQQLLDAVNAPADPDNPTVVEADPLYGIYIYNPADDTQMPVVVPEEGYVYSDVVVLDDRAYPVDIPDAVVDAALAAEGYGILDIKSVYDFDGAYNALGGPAADLVILADPAQTTAAQRPARFLRVEKAVAIPAELSNGERVPGFAFGPGGRGAGMREIVGYVPIEPDGSVKVKIPANVPLAISVLDQNARRITARHENWIQVMPGETLACNGCHSSAATVSYHGHAGEPPALNTGAAIGGTPFPNTEATFTPNAGETMAQARTRVASEALDLSHDVVYEDVWTDPMVRPADVTFGYLYKDLATPAPVSSGCLSAWSVYCRIVINYETHIHPLWSVPRTDATAGDVTCTNCHTSTNSMMAAQVPPGAKQLDLTDGPSSANADQFKAFRTLLFNKNQQELRGGVLADVLVPSGQFVTDDAGNFILDEMGNRIPTDPVPVNISPALLAGNARGSTSFFNVFATGGAHAGWLTPAELRLISEWVDTGAQYYNDPFAVPVD
ncbi:MAG: hypothetical protein AB1810_05055 [Pseudomonadota bacterium]